jgi:molecular chaperone GrpE
MTEDKKEEITENSKTENQENQNENLSEQTETTEALQEESVDELKKKLDELNDKYLRLYAEFENYKRIALKNRQEAIQYGNEELMRELLSVIDHLELALQHASNSENFSALSEGVQMTLKELKTVLEKFDLITIEALGKPFDPNVHHAISQVESEDIEENIVVTEFRKGYKLKDRVLRAALVGVSKKPSKKNAEQTKVEEQQDENKKTVEENKSKKNTELEEEKWEE